MTDGPARAVRGAALAAAEVFLLGPLGPLMSRVARGLGAEAVGAVRSGGGLNPGRLLKDAAGGRRMFRRRWRRLAAPLGWILGWAHGRRRATQRRRKREALLALRYLNLAGVHRLMVRLGMPEPGRADAEGADDVSSGARVRR